ncbi:MAG TPA: penicillin acylase family protein [Dinghuibacter sp.]|uniref:penicillin acylase family protein n=1 Tax=Dinghuibacter sp. TaxID=2024697 RepID=UPI002CD9A0E7|nr:penicillin acylase family protein [Dinghuibacter sp.]HTJ14516.1 penicillin acylase family protein [Dinghuibacter sp.]
MRLWPFVASTLITGVLVVALDTSFKPLPALGPFFDPQTGFWQNAEAGDMSYTMDLRFQELAGPVKVCLDDKLIPHIFAQNDRDAYFAQGYVQARFRLWQMDLQTRYAAGRLSELVGRYSGGHDLLNVVDRSFRRLGMVYAAEQAVKGMEADPATKAELDAYTEGVNAYIATLTQATLPLEYKLLDYQPEQWTNLKTALLLKYMSFNLAGGEEDFPMTNARNFFSPSDFNLLYPGTQDSIDPIVPVGTQLYGKNDTPGIKLKIPAHLDSGYLMTKFGPLAAAGQPGVWQGAAAAIPDPDNGSNNWAVSGAKTRSGWPILCNDPHLGLNLPSVWYEMQIQTPDMNVYGVALPGAPGIIIGFNDSCAFGFTNAERDVRDYYQVEFKDYTRKEYKFNGDWLPTTFRIEDIKVKGEPDFYDTVAYTVWGPVMYEPAYPDPLRSGGFYAVRWTAHDVSNELLAFNQLDHAHNYNDYLAAIRNLQTPGQNCVFASRDGDIAIWDQGSFPAKWKRQGDFVMPGTDSAFAWQGMVPQAENPHMINPARGFVSSANQVPVDPKAYPYYLGRHYPPYRGMEINRRLAAMSDITPADMMALQVDNYDLFAEMARPIFLKYIDTASMEPDERSYYDQVRDWDLRNDPKEKAPSVFHTWWDMLKSNIVSDELSQSPLPLPEVYDGSLLEALLRDSSYKFVDDIHTPQTETLRQEVNLAWKKIYPTLEQDDTNNTLTWATFKDTHVDHLMRIPALGDLHLPIGGGTYSINAARSDHGPSWRMVVELGAPIKAFGIYPGGQSGNPGSRYYDDLVQDWAHGLYDTLWVMQPGDAKDPRVQWTMNFSKP